MIDETEIRSIEPDGMKIYQFEREVTHCEGSQTFQVIALNPSDALKRAIEGSSVMVGSDPEVVSLSNLDECEFHEIDALEEML